MSDNVIKTNQEQLNVLKHVFMFKYLYLIPIYGFYLYYFGIYDYIKNNGYNKQKKIYNSDFSVKKCIFYSLTIGVEIVAAIVLLIIFSNLDTIGAVIAWDNIKNYVLFPLFCINIGFWQIWSLLIHKLTIKYLEKHNS